MPGGVGLRRAFLRLAMGPAEEDTYITLLQYHFVGHTFPALDGGLSGADAKEDTVGPSTPRWLWKNTMDIANDCLYLFNNSQKK